MKVDLTLAVNYLPACACLCKLLCLMMLLSVFQPNDEARGGYIPVAALLYLDRLSTRNLIFDANSILLAVYFANIHATIRATCTHTVHALVTTIPFLAWTVLCLALLIEPAPVRRLLERRALASKYAPVLIMLPILVVTAGVFAPMEPPPIRTCRALAFTLLSFVWIYMVGIHAPQGIDFLKENSYQFVTRLAPVLYAPLWMAGPFPLIAGGVLAWQYTQKRGQTQESHEPPLQSVEVETPESADETTVKELFRQAKMARAGPGPE